MGWNDGSLFGKGLQACSDEKRAVLETFFENVVWRSNVRSGFLATLGMTTIF
jgi:hypothetical protein